MFVLGYLILVFVAAVSARDDCLAAPGRSTFAGAHAPHLQGRRLCRGGGPRDHRVRDDLQDLARDLLVRRARPAIPVLVRAGAAGCDLSPPFLFSGGLFIAFNLRLASRHVASVPRSAPWIAGFLASALVAIGAAGLWTPLTAFLGATASGVTDPILGEDLSFYLLKLPFYEGVVRLAMTLLVITLLAWAAVGIPLYRRPSLRPAWGGRTPHLHPGRRRPGRRGRGGRRASPRRPASRRGTTGSCRGMAVAALFCLGCGVLRFLGRYHLVIDRHSGVVAGASWDRLAHFYSLPAYEMVITVWVAAAIGLAVAACLPRLRRWIFASRRRWAAPLGLFAAIYLAALL